MGQEELNELREQVKQREEALALLMRLDQIRDQAIEPPQMLGQIIGAVVDAVDAELGILAVLDRDTGELHLKAVHGDPGSMDTRAIRNLAQHGFKLPEISRWDAGTLHLGGVPHDLFLASVPIIMGPRVRLGAVIFARRDRSFSEVDATLLEYAESQLDSAVIQGYAYHEIRQRNKELEVIYRIDRIRDEQLGFDDMLHRVLHELQSVIDAETGFIMLYDSQGDRLDMRAHTHGDLGEASPFGETVDRIARKSLERAHLVWESDLEGDIGEVMCIPLILREEILGVFGVANRAGARRFQEEDMRMLAAIASQMDTAIFESLEQRHLRQVLGRSVDPRIMDRLLASRDVEFLKGERAVVTVLYTDMRGSTSLAENSPPEALVQYMNDYLSTMVDIILDHEGTLDKFIGDEVMALFNAPFPQEDHALRAVRVGLAMQEAHQGIMDEWRGSDLKPAPIGVGIASGELIVGEMGSPLRTDYTVVGRAANLGSRICSVAQAGQVLISEATYELIADQIFAQRLTGFEFKGVAGQLTVYHVTGVRE